MKSLKTLKIEGEHAEIFLQGLLTCDVRNIAEEPIFTACCNSKGRIKVNFWIKRDKSFFLMQFPASMVEKILAHFSIYRLRSKITYTEVEVPIFFPIQPRGRVWILPETTELFLPQMLNMEVFGGISFTKGCYLGQEVIARAQHLGILKRYLYTAHTITEVIASPAAAIRDREECPVGTLLALAGENTPMYAIIEERAANQPLFLGGVELLEVRRV